MPSEAAARVWDGPVAVKQSADTVSVTLAAPAGGTVAEGDTAHFEVGVTGDTSAGAVTVQYAVSGTAKPGEDYAELSGELTVEAGATGALIAVATVADDIEDDGESVTITLTNATGPGTVLLRANPRTVRITDSRGRGEPPPNLPPTADAGDDFSADELTVVNLDGSGSYDPDGDDLTYAWTGPEGVALNGASTAYPSFQAPEVAPGEEADFTFELVVSDGEFDSNTDNVTVRVLDVPPPDRPPVCNGEVEVHPGETASVRLSEQCHDPDGDPITGYGGGSSEDPDVATAELVDGVVTISGVGLGDTTVPVTATAGGLTGGGSIAVTVTPPPDQPPVCSGEVEVHPGETASVRLSEQCHDPDGDPITGYGGGSSEDPDVATAELVDGVVTISGVGLGDTTVPVTATAGGLTGGGSIAVTVTPPPDQPPVCSGEVEVHPGETASVRLSEQCHDPDGDPITGYGGGSSEDPDVATAELVDGVVTISGVGLGDTTVPVTATAGGLTGGGSIAVTVTPPRDQPPVCSGEVEVHPGETASVRLSEQCHDPDGDPITGYGGGSSEDPDVATAELVDGVVTISGVGLGDTTVPVTATAGGLTGGGSIAVTVTPPRDQPPVCSGEVEVHPGETASVRLSEQCHDPDGDPITGYGGGSSEDPDVATAELVDGVVTISGVGLGDTTVPVTATAGGLTGGGSIAVTVTPPRDQPPVCSGEVEVHPGETASVRLSEQCHDPDGDPITGYGGGSSEDPDVATAELVDGVVTISGVGLGDTTVPVTATAGGLTGGGSIAVTVTPPRDQPPVCSGEVEVHPGETASVRLSEQCHDPDGDPITGYGGGSSEDPDVATAELVDGVVTISGVGLGDTTVPVTATAGGLTGGGSIAVTVTPPRDQPPVCSGEVEVHPGETASVRLSEQCHDPDGDPITGYGGGSSEDPDVATAELVDGVVTISGVGLGDTTVPVTATAGGLTGGGSIAVTVRNPPLACRMEPGELTLVVGGTGTSEVRCRGGSGSWTPGDPESGDTLVATATRSGTTVTVTGAGVGSASVSVPVTDDETTVTASVEVTVEYPLPPRPVAHAPEAVGTLPPATVAVGSSGSVGVSSHFRDRDGDTLTYAAESSDSLVVTVGVGGRGLSTVTYAGVAVGSATVTVTARDPGGLRAEQEFSVTVTQPNRAPVAVETIPAATVAVGSSGSVGVSGYFRDPDGDRLRYAAESSDASVVTVVVGGRGSSTVTYTGTGAGSATVTVTATDPDALTATQSFEVTVPNLAPVTERTIAPDTLYAGESGRVDVSGHFSDADGDALEYAAASDSAHVVTVEMDGSAVAYRAVVPGSAEVTVTASDGRASVAQRFRVTVPNRAPSAAGTIEARETHRRETGSVDVSSYFSDADGEVLRYAAATSDASVVTVEVSGARLTFRGEGLGEAEVTVTATDRLGGTAAQTFTVTVSNQAPVAEGTIGAQTVEVGGSGSVDVSAYFSDADADALSYSVSSSDSTAVTVTVADSLVTFTGLSGGSAQVTVTASDGHRGTATQTFTVTVADPNPPPVVVDSIPGQWVYRLVSDSVDVSSYFSDPEGEALAYTATSSDTRVATASVSGSTVRFSGANLGTAAVTVTARDPSGGVAEQVFAVEVRNRVPEVVGEIPADTVAVGGSGSVDASSYFREYDGELLFHEVSSSDTSVVSVNLELTTMTYRGEAPGTATVTVTATDLRATAEQTFTVTVVNEAPTASAGPDQTVEEGAEVTLVGTGDDPDGDNAALTFRWSAPSGVTLSDPAVSSPTFTAPAVESDRDYTITLAVNDGEADSAPDSVVVRVRNVNEAPTASAGPDQTVEEGAEVTLVGTGEDPDGEDAALTFRWSAPSGVTLSDPAVSSPTFTAPAVESDTDYTLTLVVSDGETDSAPDSVVVRVRNVNEAPRANAGPDQTVEEGAEVTLVGTGEDPDGEDAALTYRWSGPSEVTLSDPAAASPTFTAPAVESDTDFTLTLVVSDGEADSAPDSVVVRVLDVVVPPTNRAPEFRPDVVSRTVAENSPAVTAVGAPVTATDEDDDELTYSLAEGGDSPSFDIDGTTGQITVGSSAALDYESGDTELTVQVVASDGMLSGTALVTITVTDDDDPGVLTLDATVARVGMRVTATLADQDGSRNKRRKWQLSSDGNAPWTNIRGATSRSYMPAASDEGMWLRAVFAYTDGDGPNKRAESVAVRVTGPNEPPEFGAAALERTVPENSSAGTEVGPAVTATDGNDDELKYSFVPGGDESSFEIGGTTGLITVGSGAGLDYESGATSFTVRVEATDEMLSDTVTVTIRVTNADDAGVVTLSASAAEVGVALTATLADEDVPDAQATTVTWQRSSNEGVTWSDIAGAATASYAPQAADADSLVRAVFTYTDGHGPNKRAESAAVAVTSPNRPPEFSPDALERTVPENSLAGTQLGAAVLATDPDGDELMYSLAGPDAASFDIDPTTGRIRVGSAAALDYESGNTSLTVRVVASDGPLSATATVTITVTDADDPGVVTLDAGVARVGMRVTATLMDQDGSRSAGKTRQWRLSADGGTGWADIAGATGRFYTPVAADTSMLLRAVFMYTDGHGSGKRAESSAVRVTGSNEAPVFNPNAVALGVPENSAADTEVGVVTATDANDDELGYRFLAGGDASSFAIGKTTGRITVAAGAALNYESGDTELTVSVVASDGMLSDTAAVTITVTDADDPGVVTLDADVARAGMALTAALADEDEPDAGATTIAWQRSSDGVTPWTDIMDADAASYAPGAADEDMFLRAVFTYTDGHGSNKRAESAAVHVTGTNAVPVFSPDAVELTVAENSAAGAEVGTVAATDGNDDELGYSFAAGGDADSFEVGEATGLITVGSGASLDYESGDTELTVSVVVSDGMLADTASVTITVTNAEEPGVVTLDASAARVGTALTAALSDEDEPETQTKTVTWQQSSGGTGWTDITEAAAESYTPLAADEGLLLRAVFSYTDGHGPNKRAESDAVRVTGTNVAPEFGAAAVSLSVAENAPAGTAVGEPVTATDGNGDDLEYSLAGDDAWSFEIGEATGQITVGSGASLDSESGNTELTVEVVASDGMLADTAAVRITVTDADDPGVVTLDATVARVGVRVTAVLMDQDGSQSSGKRRRWQRSSDGGAAWTNIAGATSRFYTPVPADEGTLLRAVFTYADGDGPGKRAESAAVPVVGSATPVLSFGAETYTMPLGGSADVVVRVSPAATGTLAVGVTVGGAASETTHTVTFGAGDTEQTLAVSAAGLASGDTVVVTFGALPAGAVADAPSEARVIVSEASADMRNKSRPKPLTVAYTEPSYTAAAGGAGAGVTVRMSPAADREVLVPVTVTGMGAGAPGPGELGVPATIRFAPGDTTRTFTLGAPEGAPGGEFTLGFGELPEGVSAGAAAASVVRIVASGADAARFDESLEVGLAVLGRSVAEGARRSVGARMEAAMRGGSRSAGGWENRAAGLLGSLAGTRPGLGAAGSHRRPDGGEVLKRLLPRVSFSADLGGGQEGSALRFSVWGEGSAQGFRGEPGAVAYDGGMRALALGADAQVAPGARVGLSVMRTGGEFDYTSQSLEGTLQHGMTTVHPYLFYQPSAGLGLWAMAGYGTGQVEAAEAGRAMDATLRMISGGARLPLMRRGGFGLGLAGDIFGVRMSAGEDGAEGGATRGRALLEATYAASGLRLGAEAGGRYDAGDADTGAGAEAGASVAYAGSALDLALNGRMAFGSGGHREWGVALRLAWDPGAQGQGLRFAVSPGRGHDRSGMQGLLENGHVARGGTAREQASRVDAELGYGIAAFGNGSLDTFGRLSAREGARTWSLGTGYDVARALRFNLEAILARNAAGPDRRGLRAGLDFRF